MNKIRINNKNTYKIEVNDNGDFIEFDLTDIKLPLNILNASEKIAEIDKEYINEIKDIQEKYKDNKVEQMKQESLCELEKCEKLRIQFDNFLGQNACQKIFGDRNYYGMFAELFDELEPHFKKMKVDIKQAKKNLASKYMSNQEDVI